MSRRTSKEVDSDSSEEISPTSKTHEQCHICTDTATGRHYGAIACNGCKGFFRRTIRSHFKYKCRFKSDCQLDKHNRANCRYCRYMKCLSAGMRDDQVQMERDVIGKRNKPKNAKGGDDCESPDASLNSPPSSVQNEYESMLNTLLNSELTINNLRDTVIKQVGNVEYTTKRKHPLFNDVANLNDVLKSMHSQLLLVIEWAKTLPEFLQLNNETQKILLKNFAGQHVCLCVAYRSKETADGLKLLNNRVIVRQSNENGGPAQEYADVFYIRDCEKVMDTLVTPMRNLNMDDTEFVAMKACILFNPIAQGLSAESAAFIAEVRRKILGALDFYIRKNKPNETARALDLAFTIISPLGVLAQMISEDILFTVMSGAARIDVLMEDLILANSDYEKHIKRELSPCLKDLQGTFVIPDAACGDYNPNDLNNPSTSGTAPGQNYFAVSEDSAFTSETKTSVTMSCSTISLNTFSMPSPPPAGPPLTGPLPVPIAGPVAGPVAGPLAGPMTEPPPPMPFQNDNTNSPIAHYLNVPCLGQSPGGLYTQSSTTMSTTAVPYPHYNSSWHTPTWNREHQWRPDNMNS